MEGMAYSIVLIFLISGASGQCAWPPCEVTTPTTVSAPTTESVKTEPAKTTESTLQTTSATSVSTSSVDPPGSATHEESSSSSTDVVRSTTSVVVTPAPLIWVICALCGALFGLLMIPVIKYRKIIAEKCGDLRLRRHGYARIRLCHAHNLDDGNEDVIFELDTITVAASVAATAASAVAEVVKEKSC